MCVPVQFFWGVGKGSCMNKLAFWFSNAALNITTDILIFAIPIPSIKSLHMSTKKKIVLMVVFAFGAFACVTSIIRLKSLYIISISPDPSLDGVEIAIWSGIEVNVAIACSSISTLKPLVSKTFPRLLSSTDRSGSYGPYSASLSHNMKSFRRNKQKGTIQVLQTVRVNTEDRNASQEGSQNGLVDWSADCYSADRYNSTTGHEMG